MVRETLSVPVPSGGLNTELSDLADVPQFSKEELNMDILSDGSRARRLGLEYERGYKLSRVAAAESIESDNGQVVKIEKGFSCYEWTNYKGDGQSLLVVQIGNKICFFRGINNGVLSDEEIDYQVDLTEFAITGPTLYGWTVTPQNYETTLYTESSSPSIGDSVYLDEEHTEEYSTIESISGTTYTLVSGATMTPTSDEGVFNGSLPSSTYIGYTDSATPNEGDSVYRDRAKENIETTVVSESGGVYTLDDGSTMVYNSNANTSYLSNNYINTPVSFASAYGVLFICSPYIEVIKVKVKETYTYTYPKQGFCQISLSPLYYAGYSPNWRDCTVTIELTNGTKTTFKPFAYGGKKTGWTNTKALVDAFHCVPSSTRLNFEISGDGKKTYTFTAPFGTQYENAKITLDCLVLSVWPPGTLTVYDGWGHTSNYKPRSVSGIITGAKEESATVYGYTEAVSILPMVRDTSGVEEPGNPSNDFLPDTLTIEHLYNLLNQGWENVVTNNPDDTWTLGNGKIKDFYNSKSVYPSNALTWYVLKGADGSFAPATVTNHAFGTSLAPRGKIIMNAYTLNRAVSAGLNQSLIPPSQYSSHRPEDICFFAGRLWYALDGRVLYSQIISEDTTLADRCYQAADPTSEDVSDPVDTDGGVMNIQQCGKILRLAALGNGLCVFGDKGVVAILPGNSVGFTPTSYYQQVVSSVGTVSKRAVISVGNSIYYWSALGVFRISFNENGQLVSENISFGTIHTFFKNLKPVSISNCVAKLNAIKNEIHFMYPTNEESPKELNAILKYNIITNSWTPRDVPLTEQSSPFIVDAAELRNPIDTRPRAIVESNGDTVTSNGGVVEIKKKDEDYVGYDSLSYLVVDGNSMCVTFANCTNIEHKDWAIGDIRGNGYNYSSYLVTHPIVFQNIYMNKQSPYITTTYKRSEEGALFQSGCFMSARWNWAFASASYDWDSKQQTYRLPVDQMYRPKEYDEYREFVLTKTRIRGSGKSLQLKFENDGSKDFRLCAIGLDARGWHK